MIASNWQTNVSVETLCIVHAHAAAVFFTYILNKTTFGLLLHNSEKGPATGLDPIRFKTPSNTTKQKTRWYELPPFQDLAKKVSKRLKINSKF